MLMRHINLTLKDKLTDLGGQIDERLRIPQILRQKVLRAKMVRHMA